jgi:hypothetical protein
MTDPPAHLHRDETDPERYDRNLTELMGELRVALPGVQVLFAFLLVVPFQQRFARVSHFERDLYFATLLLTLLASTLLIAPTVLHRIVFQQGAKAYVVHKANQLTIAGLAVLACGLTSAASLITHFLLGQTATIVVAGGVGVTLGLAWFALPLRQRHRLHRH